MRHPTARERKAVGSPTWWLRGSTRGASDALTFPVTQTRSTWRDHRRRRLVSLRLSLMMMVLCENMNIILLRGEAIQLHKCRYARDASRALCHHIITKIENLIIEVEEYHGMPANLLMLMTLV